MKEKKEVYKVKPLTEGKKGCIINGIERKESFSHQHHLLYNHIFYRKYLNIF